MIFFPKISNVVTLTQKKPQAAEVARKRSVDPLITAEYFKLLKATISNIGPDRIYNIDETSFCIDPNRVKVVGTIGTAAHRVKAGPGKENFCLDRCQRRSGRKKYHF